MGIFSSNKADKPVPTYMSWQNNTNATWYKDPSLRRNAMWIAVLYLGIWISGYDGALLNGLQAMPAWGEFFNHPKGNQLGLISASAYLPAFIATPIIPWAADKYSRKPVIGFGCACIIVGAFINGFAVNTGMFIAGRAIIGFGNNFKSVGCALMIAEIAHPRLRGVATAGYNCTFYFGSSVAAWMCFGLVLVNRNWAWRLPITMQAIGPVVLLAAVFFMPQSPRWLMSKGRREEALKVLLHLHANNVDGDELVEHELVEMETSIMSEKENSAKFSDFFKTPGNRMRLYILFVIGTAVQWAGNGVVGYYLAPILRSVGVRDPRKITAINGGLAVFNLFVSSSAASCVERFGRRPLWLIGTLGMLVSFIIITGLSGSFATSQNTGVGLAVVPMLFIFYGFYDISYTPLPYVYVSEILPYKLRAKGMAFQAFVSYTALAFNQWVNPVALAAIQWKLYIVYVALLVFYLLNILFLFRETKGLSLEESGALYDTAKNTDSAEIAQKLGGGDDSDIHSEKRLDLDDVRVEELSSK